MQLSKNEFFLGSALTGSIGLLTGAAAGAIFGRTPWNTFKSAAWSSCALTGFYCNTMLFRELACMLRHSNSKPDFLDSGIGGATSGFFYYHLLRIKDLKRLPSIVIYAGLCASLVDYLFTETMTPL